jgi:hypothetical protein
VLFGVLEEEELVVAVVVVVVVLLLLLGLILVVVVVVVVVSAPSVPRTINYYGSRRILLHQPALLAHSNNSYFIQDPQQMFRMHEMPRLVR